MHVKPWILAARPKTLTAAIVPVLVGTLLANGVAPLRWSLALYALVASFFIQVGTNLVNDALDFQKGADTKERLGPVRVTQMGWLTSEQVLTAGVVSFALAVLFGTPLILAGGIGVAWVLALSVLSGYLYTGGPAPLAYHGLGDLFVILFFGLISTATMHYLQAHHVSLNSMVAGLQIGCLATVMLIVNNLRDYEEDTKTNKKTLVVRFGVDFGKAEFVVMLFAPFFMCFWWCLEGCWLAGFLPLLALPIALNLAKGVLEEQPSSVYNQFLALAGFIHLLFGVLLAAGFYLQPVHA